MSLGAPTVASIWRNDHRRRDPERACAHSSASYAERDERRNRFFEQCRGFDPDGREEEHIYGSGGSDRDTAVRACRDPRRLDGARSVDALLDKGSGPGEAARFMYECGRPRTLYWRRRFL